MSSLIIGGAGYIGAHVVNQLIDRDEDVVVVDDLSSGDARRIGNTSLTRLDITDASASVELSDLMRRHRVTTVYHFAAQKSVAASVANPLATYRQNIDGLVHVLQASVEAGVSKFVFSSSAAVYGETATTAVSEDDRCDPVNPYGRSKLAGEWLCRDVARSSTLAVACLRYFNVAGAAAPPLGERTAPNLIPQVLSRLRAGESPIIFGDDYDTPDGTCIRDYVHVSDVASAHIAVAARLTDSDGPLTLNIGTGRGYSVREVVDRAIAVTGLTADPTVIPRRAGDPASVVAEITRLTAATGWKASFGLDEMLQSSWEAINLVD